MLVALVASQNRRISCINKEMDPETNTDKFRAEMAKELRAKTIKALNKPRGIIYIAGTEEELSLERKVKQNPFFIYLTQVFRPKFQLVINIENGESFLFAPHMPERARVWDYFDPPTLSQMKQKYGMTQVNWNVDIQKIVDHIKPSIVYAMKGQKLPFQNNYPHDETLLHSTISHERAVKTEKELRMMKVAITTSALAHNSVMRNVREGLYEYQMQSHFESKCQTCGLTFQSYAPIFGASNRSAVLHYIENSRKIPTKPESNIMLVDAGADYNGYATDITRSFPANGKFTQDQKIIYETVLDAQKAAMKTIKAGSSWSDASNAATRAILEGMKTHGFVKGDINAMVGARVQSLFMMHSLGHNLGLYVHDTGPLNILKENMVVTVEPGIYFHKFLFDGATQAQKKFLIMEKINKFLNFGGIRIEDDLRITKNGYENYSEGSPREIKDIEKLMNQ
eukprot:gene3280-5722_t